MPDQESNHSKGRLSRTLGRVHPNARILLVCALCLAATTTLVVYSVPLYNIFCSVTGYGGTTRNVPQYSDVILDREVTVRFDSNVSGLAWDFKPKQTSMRLKIGQSALAYFEARNNASRPIVGRASYNVSPAKAGIYFAKVQCFCFTEQVLMPGEKSEMPVSFFVDPALADDHYMDDVTTITLSYTFFEASNVTEDSKRKVAAWEAAHGGADEQSDKSQAVY